MLKTENELVKNNVLIKSILLFQKEQFVTLYKDMSYLKAILPETGESTTIKNGLQNHIEKIKKHDELINQVLEPNELKKGDETFVPRRDLEVILFIDHNREILDNLLESLNSFSVYIQLITYNTHASNEIKPNVTRRFSSANLLEVINDNLLKRYNEFISGGKPKGIDKEHESKHSDDKVTPNISFLTKSEFISGYELERIDEKIYDLSLSYWHFDIPIIYNTAISHELGHLALQKLSDRTEFNHLYEQCTNILQTLFDNEAYKNAIDNPHNDAIYLAEELMADLIALFYHGSSYILGIFHQVYAYGLREQIGIGSGKKQFRDSDYWYDLKEPYTARTWALPALFDRDNNFIRLHMLLYAHEKLQSLSQPDKFQTKIKISSEEEIGWIASIKDALSLIYPIEEVSNTERISFKKIYQRYNNLEFEYTTSLQLQKDIFEKLENEYDKIETIYKEFFQFFPTQEQEQEQESASDQFPIFSNDLWKSWFGAIKNNKIAHKIYFRIKTHNQTIRKLEKEGILNKENLLPYKLTYKKQKDYQEPLNKDEFYSLGYYNHIEITQLDKEFSPKINDNSALDNPVVYQSLMEIMEPVLNPDLNEFGEFSVLIEVSFEQKDKLSEEIQSIWNILVKSHKNTYKKFRMFKTLGPTDIIVLIEEIKIETIKKIKKELHSKQAYKTITKILFKNKNISLLDVKYTTFLSTIRGNLSEEDINKIKDSSSRIDMVPGALDDYTIIWKVHHSYQDIDMVLKKCVNIDSYTIQIIFTE